ncbi:helix-turn-helix transcriptional regulator [Phenylobacterium sp. LjRoot219]|uniref:helix-turn-helix transcriptional regulator n=1 Tax=Phenylobacterium sp. LjRoot219 TaxID=3342283 RepID=UPI003ECF681B
MVAEAQLLAAAEGFRRAAFDGSWEQALSGAAELCGGHAAELIGIGPTATMPFNRSVNIDPAGYAPFIEQHGADPARNARVRAGLKAPILRSLTEADFGEVEAVLRSDLYVNHFRPYDIFYNIQATLMRSPTGVIGFTVIHSERRGVANADERQVFDLISPLAQEAVRLQLTLEGRGADVLRGSLENLGAAAFICDGAGRVSAMTAEAERLVAQGAHLVLKDKVLRPAHAPHGPDFSAALLRAADRMLPAAAPTELLLRSPDDGALVVCQVASLPVNEFAFGFDAAVMVVVRTPRDPTKLTPLLQGGYGLTTAEAGIALGLAQGLSLEEIAQERATSLWTVRTQLRAACAKLGVSRQAELVAKLGQL